jgi:hypothetical protein
MREIFLAETDLNNTPISDPKKITSRPLLSKIILID